MESLSKNDIDQFVNKGFVRIDNAFPKEIAEEAIEILWRDIDVKRNDPSTWTKPVIRLGMYSGGPFSLAANTPRLSHAFDQLVGTGRWIPRHDLGTFPIRFPSEGEPGDTGWHVDASFPGHDPSDFFTWRINIHSKGRALLMLFLFSDVDEHDAPTKIRVGSHLDVAKVLAAFDDEGLSFMELAAKLPELPERKEELATGEAGTVYLCHPFIVHAAQPHRGSNPKIMAQPPLMPRDNLKLVNDCDHNYSAVERAIRLSLTNFP